MQADIIKHISDVITALAALLAAIGSIFAARKSAKSQRSAEGSARLVGELKGMVMQLQANQSNRQEVHAHIYTGSGSRETWSTSVAPGPELED